MIETDGQPRESADRGTLGTVRNAMLLLDLLSKGPAHQQLSDLAERSRLSLPTVHRLLRSLVRAGLVEQDRRTARYGLGPELVRLAQHYLARQPALTALSPYLPALRDTIGSSVNVALLVRGYVAYVDRADGMAAGPYRAPFLMAPALRTAAGRVLAVHADDEAWELCLATATDDERALAERERDAWRAATHLALPGVEAGGIEVAAPVIDGYGFGAAALAATVPDSAQVLQVAAHLGRAALGVGRTLRHD